MYSKIVLFFLLLTKNTYANIFNNPIKTIIEPIKTEKNINLNYYIGNWYQVATSKSTALMGTGTNYSSVTALYECIGNCSQNNISVVNQGINNYGDHVSIKGYSFCKNINNSGKRKLKFYNLPFLGNYWIIKLGPIRKGKYDYSIVSGPLNKFIGTRFSLYVLCRDIKYYKENYEQEVKEWCGNNGFIFPWNKYIETKQNNITY